MIILIDNYDSFSYNLYQLVGTIDPDIKVIRNDELTVDEIRALKPSRIILSPGPGFPKDAGICIEAAKTLGKPRGTYVSIEADQMMEEDSGYHREISEIFSEQLKTFLPKDYRNAKILVIGLGNREVTPDALGPKVIDHLFITRHLLEEFGKYLVELDQCCSISGIVPGVMAQTGMETVEILRGIVAETKPDLVIAVDALAARSIKRLNRTIQITDTGIIPGSGVGNYRNAITEEHLGIPVIAIGIPTVVDAATIIADFCMGLMEENKSEPEEMEASVRSLISPKLNTMYVTSKDIDEAVNRLSFTISEGLNMTFVPRV